MSSGKFTVSFVAIIAAMVLVRQMTSAADPAVNGTTNGTLVNKPAASGVVPAVASNSHVNGTGAHLRVRRKGLGGIGGAVAGGVASGAAMTAIGGLLGGRV